jgi:hypothetical protein
MPESCEGRRFTKSRHPESEDASRFPDAVQRSPGDAKHRPVTMHRRAGIHRHAGWRMGPGSATHHAASAARCAASGARFAAIYASAFPPRDAPELLPESFAHKQRAQCYPKRGAGNAGCALHPRSRVRKVQKKMHTSIQVQRRASGIPRAMVLTVSFELFPVIGLCCHRHLADTSARLDVSVETSEPHDFAVRKIALSSLAPLASTASPPYVRDDRDTPLCVGRDARDVEVIWVKREREYFC